MDSYRKQLLTELSLYTAIDQSDYNCCQRLIEFIAACPYCFERTNKEGHITGSAWLMNNSGNKVLLTLHKKLGKYLQVGGHADGDGNILDVAIREAREESGIDSIFAITQRIFDVDIHTIPASEDAPSHFHYDIRYLLCASECENLLISPESVELVWVKIEELERYSNEPSLLRMKRKWLTYMARKEDGT